MCIVTFKATVVAAPIPPFVGFEVGIHVEADGLTFGIKSTTFAAGCSEHEIDWGDGTKETTSQSLNIAHAYESPSDYRIRISDTCTALSLCSTTDASKVRSVVCTAKNLITIATGSFSSCANMTKADFRHSAVETISRMAFAGCSGLSGELYLPKVVTLTYFSGKPPFSGCSGGIVKFHFGKANEEAIKASDSYKADPTLGTSTAECVFDL